MDFFSLFFAAIDTRLATYFSAHISDVISYVAPTIHTCSILIIIGVGLVSLAGYAKTTPINLIKACGAIVLVTQLATNLGNYNTYVSTFFLGLPDELMALVSGYSGSSSVGETLDDFGDAILDGVATIWNTSTGWAVIQSGLICIVIFVFWIVFSACIVIAMLLAKSVLVILITIGPIFIMLLLLPQTQNFFSKWLQFVIQFSMLAVLIGGILSITSDIILDYFNTFSATTGDIDFTEISEPLITMTVAAFLFTQLPHMASSLTGGIGIGLGSLASSSINQSYAGARRTAIYTTKKTTTLAMKGVTSTASSAKEFLQKRS